MEGFERPAPGRTEQLGGWVCNKASVRETCLRSCFLLTRLGVCGRQSVREVRRREREREREREVVGGAFFGFARSPGAEFERQQFAWLGGAFNSAGARAGVGRG